MSFARSTTAFKIGKAQTTGKEKQVKQLVSGGTNIETRKRRAYDAFIHDECGKLPASTPPLLKRKLAAQTWKDASVEQKASLQAQTDAVNDARNEGAGMDYDTFCELRRTGALLCGRKCLRTTKSNAMAVTIKNMKEHDVWHSGAQTSDLLLSITGAACVRCPGPTYTTVGPGVVRVRRGYGPEPARKVVPASAVRLGIRRPMPAQGGMQGRKHSSQKFVHRLQDYARQIPLSDALAVPRAGNARVLVF